MLRELERLIRAHDMIPPGSRVLCALSGGADSVCLLAGLYELRDKLPFSLAAAHFDHRLRGEESRRDVEFVQQLLSRRFPDIPLYLGSGDVAAAARERGQGLEETARALRYDFLRRTAQEQGCLRIATAHTADDNAETVLLHLARGSGLRGLTGIPPVNGDIIRPLLTAARSEVEAYLKQADLPHVEDSTNLDDTFSRNRVRHQVTPVLEELYPGFARRLTENAAHLRRDEAFLSQLGEELARQAEEQGGALTISASLVARAPYPVAVRCLRLLLARLRGGDDSCSAPHLESLLALCTGESPSAMVHLPGGLTARREYQRLVLEVQEEVSPLPHIPLASPGVTHWGPWTVTCTPAPYAGERQGKWDCWLARDRVSTLTIRPRRTGDQLKLPGRPTKSVKKWLVEEKIPKIQRDTLPVLDRGGAVAAVAGLGAALPFIPLPGEDAWHIVFENQRNQS